MFSALRVRAPATPRARRGHAAPGAQERLGARQSLSLAAR
jgi:hypothetical protein